MNGIPEIKVGDKVALVLSIFDPPTMDHVRAIEALSAKTEISGVWVCPISGDNNDHVRSMTSMLCADLSVNSKMVSLCTVGLDKKMSSAADIVFWIRSKFKYLKFQVATVVPETVTDTESVIQVFFGPGASIPEGTDGIVLDKHLSITVGLKDRIKAGIDEARSFPSPIWDYIQKHRLYRP